MLVFLTILRPLNLLLATLSVILTTVFLGEFLQLKTLLLLILSVISINGAGNIINDIMDIEIDRVNRPNRPLPEKKISLPTARTYAVSLFSIGILFSWLISIQTFIIAGLLATPILIIYSAYLKRLPLIGNIMVSFMLGLTFIYVGSAFGAIEETWVMAALAFGFTLIREIVKDLEDMEGDQRLGARTLPLTWGEKQTTTFAILLICVFVLLDILPFTLGSYEETYLWIVLLGINIPLLVCAFILWKFPGKINYTRIQIFLKLNIFVGLTALYLGRPL